MRNPRVRIALVLATLVLVFFTGCVSKKVFRRNVEDTEAKVTSVEGAVEANERRIKDLRSETDSKIAALEGQTEKAVEVGSRALDKAEVATLKAEEAARGKLLWSVTLSDDRVKFSFDQGTIPDDSKSMLDDLIAKIKSYDKALFIEIEGHTDATGAEAYNAALGEKRAMAVRNYLTSKGGIPLHAINTISYGESQPVADNSTPAGRSQNRRVVIRVLE